MPQLHALGSIPCLHSNQIQVWAGSLDVRESDLQVCESVLSDDEQERAGRFHFEKDRHHFVAARGILRHLLAKHMHQRPDQVVFHYGEKGKPELKGDPMGLAFNVSHSHSVGAWAFSLAGVVGVDVEWTGRKVDVDAVGKRFFSTNEWATLGDLPVDKRKTCFFNCWTRKEAFVKALGDGLSFSLKAFDVSVGSRATLSRIDGDFDPQNWSLESFEPAESYVGCVAFEGHANVAYQRLLA